MADARSRRTGEHNQDLLKLMADVATMREQIEGLTARVVRLESELAAARASAPGKTPSHAPGVPRPGTRASAPAPASAPGTRASAPAPASAAVVPPRLPPSMPALPGLPSRSLGGGRSIVDISEIAELVDSIPPPAPRPPKK